MADTNEVERMSVVELVDENGQNAQFEHLMTLEHKGSDYIVLYPLDEIEGVDEDEVMIMRVESDGEADTYYPVEDTETLEEVFSIFMETFEDEDDDDDGFDENDEDGGPL
jgi:uncharacterized protein YrzB (UPF0473 family)